MFRNAMRRERLRLEKQGNQRLLVMAALISKATTWMKPGGQMVIAGIALETTSSRARING